VAIAVKPSASRNIGRIWRERRSRAGLFGGLLDWGLVHVRSLGTRVVEVGTQDILIDLVGTGVHTAK
jgi:hypothetical protein